MFEFEVYCNHCDSSDTEHLKADEYTNLPVFFCKKCGEIGSLDNKFSYLVIE